MDFKSFTDKYFNGNAVSAIHQLVKESMTEKYTYSGSPENIEQIVSTMNKKALETYVKCGFKVLSENPQYYKNGVKLQECYAKTGMEEKEIIACEKNPFTGKALGAVFTFFGIFALFVLVLVVGLKVGFLTSDNSGIVSSIFSITVISFLSFWFKNINRYFLFNKAKKLIEKEKELKAGLVLDGIFGETESSEELLAEEADTEEKKMLTVGDVVQHAAAYYKNLRSMFLAASIFAVFFLALILITTNPLEELFAVIASVGTLIACLVLMLKNAVCLRKINKLKFSLVPSECLSVNKTNKEDDGSHGTVKITMEKYGNIKFNILNGAHPMMVTRHFQYLARSLKAGDNCLLLVPDGRGKICAIFPLKDYGVAQKDFVHNEKGYRPVEGMSVKDYVKRDIDQQFISGELTEEEKNDIKNAEKRIAEAGTKNNIYFAVILVLIPVTFIGIVFKPVAAAALLGWLFAYIPAKIVAFIATLKTKKAFDKVTSKYTAYTSLNGLQGKVAAKLLILLAIGTLLFVCGILFSFMSITE